MAILILRNQKGTPLTNNEVDGNFIALNSELIAATSSIGNLQSNVTNLTSPIQIITNNTNATIGKTYYVMNNVVINLPTTPSIDDSITFVAKSVFNIDPGALKINGSNGVMTVDNPPITFYLQYNATLGWIVI
jgi:hypothetical protein